MVVDCLSLRRYNSHSTPKMLIFSLSQIYNKKNPPNLLVKSHMSMHVRRKQKHSQSEDQETHSFEYMDQLHPIPENFTKKKQLRKIPKKNLRVILLRKKKWFT